VENVLWASSFILSQATMGLSPKPWL